LWMLRLIFGSISIILRLKLGAIQPLRHMCVASVRLRGHKTQRKRIRFRV
jgi:hypothetical protein